MPVLVTGATGFLGGHLVERLVESGQSVRALVRKQRSAWPWGAATVETAQGDVTQPASLATAAAGCDVIYHLAARVSDWGPWSDFEAVTVQGTENLLAAAVRAGCRRVVLVSTAVVYDDRHARRARRIPESAPLGTGDRAYGHYARAKVLAEDCARSYHESGRVEVVILRPTWIYGPRDGTILPRLLEHYEGRFACWIGRRDPCVDPIYVTDVADAAVLAGTHSAAAGRAFNVSPDREIGLREFLGALFQELAIRPPRLTVPYSVAWGATWASETWSRLTRAREAPEMTWAGLACLTVDQHVDPSAIIRDLGWTPRVPLATGARQTADWLRCKAAPHEAT